MRVILGCPMSTRIVDIQCELRLPPLVEIIYSNVTRLTVKCLHFPHLSPHYSQLIKMSLGPALPVPPILPAGRALIRSVSSLMGSLDLDSQLHTASAQTGHYTRTVRLVAQSSRLTWSLLQGVGLAVASVTTPAPHCVSYMPY